MFFMDASLAMGGRFADQRMMAQRGRWLGEWDHWTLLATIAASA